MNRSTRPPRRAFLMVWDGLRPDAITEQWTPNLHRLAAAGVRFTNSHAVYPTVTRVNSPSISTGMLPAGHGIPNNAFLAPGLVEGDVLNTGNNLHLEALRPGRGGRLIPASSLAERLAAAGRQAVVVSTGSPGSTLLQFAEAATCGGRLINPALLVGADRADLEARLGPIPPRATPATALNAWFTRLITEVMLPNTAPDLLVFWHTDPDHTQHARGAGHPAALQSLHDADTNLGAILATLEHLGLAPETAVVVTSDHGFATITGRADLRATLAAAGLTPASGYRVVGDMVSVEDHDPARAAAALAVLQRTSGIGPFFTGRNGASVLPGTFALADIGAGGDFCPDLLCGLAWSDEPNVHGWPGTSLSPFSNSANAGSHGNLSPWEIRNSLVAAGPGFARGLVSTVPAGNVDIAPTLLHLLGLPGAGEMDGRVLAETLAGGPSPDMLAVETLEQRANTADSRHTARFSLVEGTRYFDWGRSER